MNNKMYRYTKISSFGLCLLMLVILFSPEDLYCTKASASVKAGEQKKAEKGLKDNKFFLYYIDSSVSNTGSESDKELYATAIKHDIVARFYYLRYSFSESFHQIRTAQLILIGLYRSNLDAEIILARKYLHNVAPVVVYSNDQRARLYLRLAYRNAKHARIYMTMADHYKPTLYSLRLYKYVKAMKKVKEAKRYAVTAMLQTRLTDKHLLVRTHHSFDDLKKLIEEKSPPSEKQLSLQFHIDSYYRFDTGSLFKAVWDEPDLESFIPFKNYLETTD